MTYTYNFDHFFGQGRTHAVCQDYAYSADRRGMVSDGCSSSPDTDIGARLLVRSAHGSTVRGAPLDPDFVAREAREVAAQLMLSETCLDATLGAVRMVDGGLSVVLYGDGHVLARRRAGGIERWDLEQPQGAPRYPSYGLDQERERRYLQTYGEQSTLRVVDPDGMAVQESDGRLDLFFAAHRYDMVVVATDGLGSFQQYQESATSSLRTPVPIDQVVPRVLDVQHPGGLWLQRRMRRFLGTECAARGWTHDDDVGMVGVVVTE